MINKICWLSFWPIHVVLCNRVIRRCQTHTLRSRTCMIYQFSRFKIKRAEKVDIESPHNMSITLENRSVFVKLCNIIRAQSGFYMAPSAFLSVISRNISHDVLIMRFQGYHMKCTHLPLPGDNLTPTGVNI